MEITSPNDLPKDFGVVTVCEKPWAATEEKQESPAPKEKTKKKKKPIVKKCKKKSAPKKTIKKEVCDLAPPNWYTTRSFSNKYKFLSIRQIAYIVSDERFNPDFKIKINETWFFDSLYFVFFVATHPQCSGSKKLMIQAGKKRKSVFNLMEKALGKRLATTLCS